MTFEKIVLRFILYLLNKDEKEIEKVKKDIVLFLRTR
jgi:hypothetical protein